MSRLQLPRVARPVSLVAVGILVGAGLMAPVAARVGAPAPAAIHTRAASCSGYGFHVLDTTVPAYYGAGVYTPHLTGSGFFVCDPGLPNGAVVTKVQFSVSDGTNCDDACDVRNCGLDRVDLRTDIGHIETLASVPATGPHQAPGSVRLTDATIEHATVDTARYGYWLQCQVLPEGTSLYGATVTYRISDANG